METLDSANLIPCDCCDYQTIPKGSDYHICPVCFWEQDWVGFDKPDERSSANHGLTLRQGRWNFEKIQACEERFIKNTVPEQSRQQFKRTVRHLNDLQACIVNCSNVFDEEDLWEAYLNAAKPDGAAFFGKNLDAFLDALNGGPGYPGERVVYFINTSNMKGFKGGCFYPALRQILEESDAAVYVE